MRHRYCLVLVVLLAFLLSACGGQLTNGEVTGAWNAPQTETTNAFSLQLSQRGTSVDGSLSLDSTQIPISGTFTRGLLELEGQDDVGPIEIQASVSSDTMQGRLSFVNKDTGATDAISFTATR